jgi:tripartite-type tricarboxylate transporter receptor subunit TctC
MIVGCTSPAPNQTTATTSAPLPSTAAPAAWAPTKYLQFIVPFAPGGANDVYSRATALTMSKYLGQEVVVKNVVGADGATGAMQLYRSKPDGYTIGLLDAKQNITNMAINPPDYDFMKFTWVGGINKFWVLIAVANSSPWKSVADLQKASQDKPLRFACGGVSVTEALIPLLLNIKVKYVTGYGGTGEYVIAVVRGDADICAGSPNAMLSFISSKDIKPIFYAGPENDPQYVAKGIDMASAKDIPDLQATMGNRVVGLPPGTPDNITKVLQDAFVKSMKDPTLNEWAKKTDNPLVPSTPKEINDTNQTLLALCQKYIVQLKELVK